MDYNLLGSNPCLLHWQADSWATWEAGWVPFSRESSQPGIESGTPALQVDSLPPELPGKSPHYLSLKLPLSLLCPGVWTLILSPTSTTLGDMPLISHSHVSPQAPYPFSHTVPVRSHLCDVPSAGNSVMFLLLAISVHSFTDSFSSHLLSKCPMLGSPGHKDESNTSLCLTVAQSQLGGDKRIRN